jgi:inner membrane protein
LDNVTHTLVGALLGETAARNAPQATSDRHAAVRRMMFLAVMVVGSNLPDSDLLYSLGSDDKLPYLLEHRGHTHTVVGALIASMVMLIVCRVWQRLRDTSMTSRDWVWLTALAFVAPLLHVAMDALNSYGVHPWWPVDNRWFYGDAVFIVEPLFWAAAAPLVFLLKSYVGRGFVVLCLVAALYLAFSTGIVAFGSIVTYGVLAVTMLALGRFAAPRAALAAALGVCAAIGIGFAVAGHQAVARVDAAAAQLAGWTTLDRVLTPLPMNPFCWEVILVQAQGDRYALRRASASITASSRCPTLVGDQTITAPLQTIAAPGTPFVRWGGEIVASREGLRRMAATSCEVAAFLRFARAPWFSENAQRRFVGDLRFDRETELGFAELDVTRSSRCPSYVPPWTPPRQDLIAD